MRYSLSLSIFCCHLSVHSFIHLFIHSLIHPFDLGSQSVSSCGSFPFLYFIVRKISMQCKTVIQAIQWNWRKTTFCIDETLDFCLLGWKSERSMRSMPSGVMYFIATKSNAMCIIVNDQGVSYAIWLLLVIAACHIVLFGWNDSTIKMQMISYCVRLDLWFVNCVCLCVCCVECTFISFEMTGHYLSGRKNQPHKH